MYALKQSQSLLSTLTAFILWDSLNIVSLRGCFNNYRRVR